MAVVIVSVRVQQRGELLYVRAYHRHNIPSQSAQPGVPDRNVSRSEYIAPLLPLLFIIIISRRERKKHFAKVYVPCQDMLLTMAFQVMVVNYNSAFAQERRMSREFFKIPAKNTPCCPLRSMPERNKLEYVLSALRISSKMDVSIIATQQFAGPYFQKGLKAQGILHPYPSKSETVLGFLSTKILFL